MIVVFYGCNHLGFAIDVVSKLNRKFQDAQRAADGESEGRKIAAEGNKKYILINSAEHLTMATVVAGDSSNGGTASASYLSSSSSSYPEFAPKSQSDYLECRDSDIDKMSFLERGGWVDFPSQPDKSSQEVFLREPKSFDQGRRCNTANLSAVAVSVFPSSSSESSSSNLASAPAGGSIEQPVSTSNSARPSSPQLETTGSVSHHVPAGLVPTLGRASAASASQGSGEGVMAIEDNDTRQQEQEQEQGDHLDNDDDLDDVVWESDGEASFNVHAENVLSGKHSQPLHSESMSEEESSSASAAAVKSVYNAVETLAGAEEEREEEEGEEEEEGVEIDELAVAHDPAAAGSSPGRANDAARDDGDALEQQAVLEQAVRTASRMADWAGRAVRSALKQQLRAKQTEPGRTSSSATASASATSSKAASSKAASSKAASSKAASSVPGKVVSSTKGHTILVPSHQEERGNELAYHKNHNNHIRGSTITTGNELAYHNNQAGNTNSSDGKGTNEARMERSFNEKDNEEELGKEEEELEKGDGKGAAEDVRWLSEALLLEQEQEAHRRLHQGRRDADGLTMELREDVMALLRAFNLPYIVAPFEAEAQCAVLEQVCDDGDE